MRGRLTACNMCPYAASTLVSQVMSVLTYHCQALYQHHRKPNLLPTPYPAEISLVGA